MDEDEFHRSVGFMSTNLYL